MNRIAILTCITLMIVVSLPANADEAVQKALEKARAIYEKEKEAYRTSILDAFDRREEAARKSADKKLLDQIKLDRDAFENWHAIPVNVPPAVSKRRVASRQRMESALNSAVKAYVRAKDDKAAVEIEKELKSLRSDDWPHLDLDSVAIVGDTIQIGTGLGIATKEEFSGPIEINTVARTEKDNIRVYATCGASVIFNWEVDNGVLSIGRPDGQGGAGGSPVSTGFTPLKPGVWYKLRWRITHEGMQIFVNDEIVFSEKKKYDLTTGKSQILIRSLKSALEVKDFYVIPLAKEP